VWHCKLIARKYDAVIDAESVVRASRKRIRPLRMRIVLENPGWGYGASEAAWRLGVESS